MSESGEEEENSTGGSGEESEEESNQSEDGSEESESEKEISEETKRAELDRLLELSALMDNSLARLRQRFPRQSSRHVPPTTVDATGGVPPLTQRESRRASLTNTLPHAPSMDYSVPEAAVEAPNLLGGTERRTSLAQQAALENLNPNANIHDVPATTPRRSSMAKQPSTQSDVADPSQQQRRRSSVSHQPNSLSTQDPLSPQDLQDQQAGASPSMLAVRRKSSIAQQQQQQQEDMTSPVPPTSSAMLAQERRQSQQSVTQSPASSPLPLDDRLPVSQTQPHETSPLDSPQQRRQSSTGLLQQAPTQPSPLVHSPPIPHQQQPMFDVNNSNSMSTAAASQSSQERRPSVRQPQASPPQHISSSNVGVQARQSVAESPVASPTLSPNITAQHQSVASNSLRSETKQQNSLSGERMDPSVPLSPSRRNSTGAPGTNYSHNMLPLQGFSNNSNIRVNAGDLGYDPFEGFSGKDMRDSLSLHDGDRSRQIEEAIKILLED